MGQVILCVDDDASLVSSSYSADSMATATCRICHEGEFESCKKLETPCACSGTIKFAHRDCIMRWCNEKGNAICEICLQKFEPGYTVAPKKKDESNDLAVTISVEMPRNIEEVEEEEERRDYTECGAWLYTSVSYCRWVALMLTYLLMTRHMLQLLWQGTGDYPFTLLTLLLLRAAGILLPMYVLIRIMTSIQNTVIMHPSPPQTAQSAALHHTNQQQQQQQQHTILLVNQQQQQQQNQHQHQQQLPSV